jgi:hypothetical protein
MNLTINKELLEKFLNSVLTKIIVKPGIYLKTLKKDYCTILQPMVVRELVEVCILLIYIIYVFTYYLIIKYAFIIIDA